MRRLYLFLSVLAILLSLFVGTERAEAQASLLAWNNQGLTESQPVLAPSSQHSGISVYSLLSLGPGLEPGSLTNAWGSSNVFDRTSKEAAIEAGQYFTVHFGPSQGETVVSLERIRFNLRITQAAYENPEYEVQMIWQYSLNGVTFTDIGLQPYALSPEATGAWHTSGVAFNRFLGGIPIFQDSDFHYVFRLVAWLQKKEGEVPGDIAPASHRFALNLGRRSGNDLDFIGTVTAAGAERLIGWNPDGLSGSSASFEPTTLAPTVVVHSPLSLGPGLAEGGLSNAWGSGTQFNQTSMEAAVAQGQYFSFEVGVSNESEALRLRRLHMNVRLVEEVYVAGSVRFVWQYRVGTGGYQTIGVPQSISPETTGPWDTDGVTMPSVDLFGEVVPLQILDKITFRLVAWTVEPGSFSFSIGRKTGDDLALSGVVVPAVSGPESVPGVLISQVPTPPDRGYVASPSITILSDGSYIASHDLFGPNTQEDTVRIFRSEDRGETWSRVSTLYGQFWSTVFSHGDDLYMYGYTQGAQPRSTTIRRSLDRGITWSDAVIIREGGGGTPNTPAIFAGRLWIARSGTQAMSAPVDADLLNPASWSLTPVVPSSTNWLNGAFDFWSEAQIVAAPHTGVVVLPKVHNLPYTGRIRVTGPVSPSVFNPATDFSFFPGGEKKFGVQYDSISGRFFALSNPVLEEHANDPVWGDSPAMIRNAAAILSSPDLIDWKVEEIFLYSPNLDYEAFQYLNFAIDGEDLAVVSRTAFDVGGVKPTRGHDSNLITFHRIENFRDFVRGDVQIPKHFPVMAGLVAYLDSDTVEVEDGRVIRMIDQSGFGNHANEKQGSGPISVAGATPSGRPVLEFDGLGTFLEIGENRADFDRSGMTMLTVFRARSYGVGRILNSGYLTTDPENPSGPVNYRLHGMFTPNGEGGRLVLQNRDRSGSPRGATSGPGSVELEEFYVGVNHLRDDGQVEAVVLDSAKVRFAGSGTGANAVPRQHQFTRVGAGSELHGPGVVDHFHGDVAAVVIFNRALETDELEEVEMYLWNKYMILDSAVVSFEEWIAGFDLPQELRGPGADASGDGVTNLHKYAFGLDPSQSSRDGLPTVSWEGEGEGRSLKLRIPKNPVAAVDIVVETSRDLVEWSFDETEFEVVEESADELVVRLFPVPGTSGRGFVRVRILSRDLENF